MTASEHLPAGHEFATPTELEILFKETRTLLVAYCPPDQYIDEDEGPYRSLDISVKALCAWAPQEAITLGATKKIGLALWPGNPTDDATSHARVMLDWYHRWPSPYMHTFVTFGPAAEEPDGWYQDRGREFNPHWEATHLQPGKKEIPEERLLNSIFGNALNAELGLDRLVRI